MPRDLDRNQIAQDVLVSLASYLALEVTHRLDRDLLLQALARVLPRCETGPPELNQVRTSAERFLAANDDRSRSAELIYMAQAVRNYHRLRAWRHLNALQAKGGRA